MQPNEEQELKLAILRVQLSKAEEKREKAKAERRLAESKATYEAEKTRRFVEELRPMLRETI